MNPIAEKPKNDEKPKGSSSKDKDSGTGCSGCLSIIVFFLELFSFFT